MFTEAVLGLDRRLSRALFAVLAAGLLTAGSCGDDSSSSSNDNGAGQPTPPLWNDQSTTSAGGTGDTPLLWNDPNTANTQFGITDPTDTRTYTYPDIYILGNKHPLMTDINQRDFPVNFAQENRLTELIIEWRIQEYERAIGIQRTQPNFPRAAFLTEFVDLRRNARSHSKHYAVWHTTVGFPGGANAEGDNVGGRLTKSMIAYDGVGQLISSGTTYGIPDRVFTQWVTASTPFMRDPVWTHLGVGYWAGTGSSALHYWTAIFATNPRASFTAPAIPIIFF
jgi:hypothetical protein